MRQRTDNSNKGYSEQKQELAHNELVRNLIIVESPSKSKTIGKYVFSIGNFYVVSSYGHIRSIPSVRGAVDIDDGFNTRYVTIAKNKKHIDVIIEKAKISDVIYLATDPDREGEAIAWHILEILKKKIKDIGEKRIYRISFHEITEYAVINAISNPSSISMQLVYAQQTRQIMDYIFGFKISPILWRYVAGRLSAGRVQSPALSMIVRREEEIQNFVPVEYWTLDMISNIDEKKIEFHLSELNGEKTDKFYIKNGEQAESIKNKILKLDNKFSIQSISDKTRKDSPNPPFITSTLQQYAFNKLGFSTSKTMLIAQQLYEGIEVNENRIGLITYMRTDSTKLSNDFINDAKELILSRFGKEYVPEKLNKYESKIKNAQEAHEAIRPTYVGVLPQDAKNSLSEDQYRLYELIWNRAVSSQMKYATISTKSIVALCRNANAIFKCNINRIEELGYMILDSSARVESEKEESILDIDLKEGNEYDISDIIIKQHHTEPLPRYSEAGLVKDMVHYGIGRPSTYATIIKILNMRQYVITKSGRMFPTILGKSVYTFLDKNFKRYIDYGFTSEIEDELDDISNGIKEQLETLEKFWSGLKETISNVTEISSEHKNIYRVTEEKCPLCSKDLILKAGKSIFIGCTGYPECVYHKDIIEKEEMKVENGVCPICGNETVGKRGRFGVFRGCTKYPDCKYMERIKVEK